MRFRTYCFPVRLMVATRISEAVPIIMPSAVRRKRTLLERKVSKAKLKISPKMTWGLGRAAVATAVGIKLVRCYLGVGGSGKGTSDRRRRRLDRGGGGLIGGSGRLDEDCPEESPRLAGGGCCGYEVLRLHSAFASLRSG